MSCLPFTLRKRSVDDVSLVGGWGVEGGKEGR